MKHLLGQLPVELHDFALSAYLAHLHGNSHVLVALEDQMACNAFAKVAAQILTKLFKRRAVRILQCSSRTSLDEVYATLLQKNTTSQVSDTLVISCIEELDNSKHLELLELLREGRFEFGALHTETSVYNLPDTFMCVGVVSNASSSVRHEDLNRLWGLQRNLANRFSLCSLVAMGHEQLNDINLPSQFSSNMPNNLPSMPSNFIAPALRVYASNLLSAVKHHPLISPINLTLKADQNTLLAFAAIYSHLIQAKDVLPIHVATIFQSFVLHRIKPRKVEDLIEVRCLGVEKSQVKAPTAQDVIAIMLEILQSV